MDKNTKHETNSSLYRPSLRNMNGKSNSMDRKNAAKYWSTSADRQENVPKISPEEFKSFSDVFFAYIEQDLFELVTSDIDYSTIKYLDSKKAKRKKCRRYKLNILEHKIKDAILFGYKDKTFSSSGINKEGFSIKSVSKEIFDLIVLEVYGLSYGDIFEIPECPEYALLKQIMINNKRKIICKDVLEDRIKMQAYIYALNMLEDDIEKIFTYKSKRNKNSREYEIDDFNSIVDKIDSFKKTYGNTNKILDDFCDFDDVFKSDENVDLNSFNISIDKYFE